MKWTWVEVLEDSYWARDFLDGVIIKAGGPVVWFSDCLFIQGFKVKLKENDMDNNTLVRRDDE